jgi:hypothetical protein
MKTLSKYSKISFYTLSVVSLFALSNFISVSAESVASSTPINIITQVSTKTDICVDYNLVTVKLDDMSLRSSTTQQRLTSLNIVLSEEIVKKASIVNSLKNIFSLKKTDKQILEEIQSIVGKAGIYYKSFDISTLESKNFIKENICVKLEKKEVVEKLSEIEGLDKAEDKYRKQLTQNLKDKLKLISKEIEFAKEKQKEQKEVVKLEKKSE